MPRNDEGEPAQPLHLVLKLSGEMLGGPHGTGIEGEALDLFVRGIAFLRGAGLGVSVVVGGGNIFRGVQGQARGFDRVTGDYMGMLATHVNALALHDALARDGSPSEVFTPFDLPAFSTRFRAEKARATLAAGSVVLYAGGTGTPFFSTDSGAALRAAETGAALVAKGTKVDGVYTADPKRDPGARKLARLSYQDVLERDLKVMDAAAISICREADVPIFVFDATDLDNFAALARGDWAAGSLVGSAPARWTAPSRRRPSRARRAGRTGR